MNICCGVIGEGETPTPIEPTSRPTRPRGLDLFPLKYMADVAVPPPGKRPRLHRRSASSPSYRPRDCQNAVENCRSINDDSSEKEERSKKEQSKVDDQVVPGTVSSSNEEDEKSPKFGVTSVCGRRRDMEDSVSVRPFFCHGYPNFHYFGVFDGHGCSHVATICKERLHQIVEEEIHVAREKNLELEWKLVMERSFARMDDEVQSWSQSNNRSFTCRCELQTPHCDAVGSTAVVAVVTPDKIIVSNCGDSRAVLCRNGVAVALSSDHKPDRPDEMTRVQAAGGRVINWDVPRVLGVLSMSRAIGDNYLKPYVISEPEVMVTEQSNEDECLILASDGLWDVVSNDTASGVVRMCLKAERPASPPGSPGSEVVVDGSDKACSDASILLTKLALARHSSDNVSVVVVDLRRDHKQQSKCENVNNNKQQQL